MDTLTIKKFQMIHNQAQTGQMTAALSVAIKGQQAKNGLPATGLIDSNTLNLYKQKWPYAWGLSATSPVKANPSSGADFSPILDKVIGGILLFGIFKVLMKVF